MDINGTRFLLVQGERDWRDLVDGGSPPGSGGIFYDSQWGGIALQRQTPVFPAPASGGLDPSAARGIAADPSGNIFWVDGAASAIHIRPGGVDATGTFWPDVPPTVTPPPGAFRRADPPTPRPAPLLTGLAVTCQRLLVAGFVEPGDAPGSAAGGLLIFDLYRSGPPERWDWPEALTFTPRHLAATADGGVMVLDQEGPAGGYRLWRLDARLAPVPAGEASPPEEAAAGDFIAVDGSSPIPEPLPEARTPRDSDARPIDAVDPIGMVALADGSVVIVDRGAADQPSVVRRYRWEAGSSAITLDAVQVAPALSAPIVNAHAFTFIADADPAPGTISGALFIDAADGGQVFRLRLFADGDQFDLTVEPVSLPLAGHTGKGLVTSGGDVYYDIGERWFALAEQPRYRYATQGTLEGEDLIFDSRTPDCVWHRLIFDGCLPNGAAVRVETRASNEPRLLTDLPYRPEPEPLRRLDGSEIPWHRPFIGLDQDSSAGTFETLLQEANGRYIQLRLTLTGDGRSSPRLRALRLYYPRFSYLQEYLPGVYRDDGETAPFLDRWLANPEGLFTALEGRVAGAETILDPRIAPDDYLPWLAGWLGTLLDPAWDERRRRLFLRYAARLFPWRGTMAAMQTLIHLAVDPCVDDSLFAWLDDESSAADGACGCSGDDGGIGFGVRIVEGFRLRLASAVALGDPTAADRPYIADPAAPWQPEQGAEALHQRFAAFVGDLYRQAADGDDDAPALARLNGAWEPETPITAFAAVRFSPVEPANGVKADDWTSFIDGTLGFPWAIVRAGDLSAWQAFLAQRYGDIDALNAAYGRGPATSWSSFATVPLPAEDSLPAAGVPLFDWIRFVSKVLPVQQNAHRFSVLIPTDAAESAEVLNQRVALVEAVVEREKPAHTAFDVRPFWALFQVGTARLGFDSVLGDSGRYLAMVLDAGHLGERYLAEGHPWDVGLAEGRPPFTADRTVVGRDRLEG